MYIIFVYLTKYISKKNTADAHEIHYSEIR